MTSKTAKGKTGSKTGVKTAAKKKEPQRTGRKKAVIAGVVIAMAVIGCIALVMNVGGLAKMAVSKVASDTLGVPVKIASLEISLQDKQMRAKGITVANPAGYSNPLAATIGEIDIEASQVKQDFLEFSKVTVKGTKLFLEVKPEDTNLLVLRRKALESKQSKKEDRYPVKVAIHEMVIEQPQLQPAGLLTENVSSKPVTLPDIRINGARQNYGGVPAPESIAQATDFTVQVAMRHAITNGMLEGMPADNLRDIQDGLGIPGGLMDQVRELGDKVKGLFSH